jgi:hypothetical protein
MFNEGMSKEMIRILQLIGGKIKKIPLKYYRIHNPDCNEYAGFLK